MCDTLAIVENGRVLFGKNSDRDPNEAQLLEWHPRRAHAVGALVQCTYLEIPQTRETNAVLLSRPFWMWGAEIGANEHGVVIGNEAVFTREPYAKIGLTGMDLLRLALERAHSAEGAVATIMALVDEYGQGGGCGHENRRFTYHNSYIVADPRRAFVLETAGRLHAVEEINGARSISNGLTIPGFARAHSDTIKTRVSACRQRRERTQERANQAQCVADVVAILRDHGAGHDEPAYSWLNGAMNAPCMHAGGVTAASQTTASWVCELSPRGQSHWVTGTAAPCVSLFKPVYSGLVWPGLVWSGSGVSGLVWSGLVWPVWPGLVGLATAWSGYWSGLAWSGSGLAWLLVWPGLHWPVLEIDNRRLDIS